MYLRFEGNGEIWIGRQKSWLAQFSFAIKKPKHIKIQQSVTFGSSENGVGKGERPRSGNKVGLRGR